MMARTLTEWHENKLRCLLNSSFSAVRDREVVKKVTNSAGRFCLQVAAVRSKERTQAANGFLQQTKILSGLLTNVMPRATGLHNSRINFRTPG
jgi:hypothetical protein